MESVTNGFTQAPIRTGLRLVISALMIRIMDVGMIFLDGGLKNTTIPVANEPEYSNGFPRSVLLVGTLFSLFLRRIWKSQRLLDDLHLVFLAVLIYHIQLPIFDCELHRTV